ncbi:SEN2-like domain-containing protein [Stetteria hydrogenophila]
MPGAAIEGVLEGCGVRITGCGDPRVCRLLEERGYIENGVLDGLEAFYQAVAGRLSLQGLTGWSAALAVVEACDVPFKAFITYLDLRRRGRLPRRGVRPGTLEVARGQKVYEVLILEEGETTTYGFLAEWSRSAVADGRQPVIAIVDRNGDVTYYEARAVKSLS